MANETLRGVLFGAVGGAVGTFLMPFYWKAATALHGKNPLMMTNEGPPHALDSISAVGEQAREDEGSTEAVGRIIHESVTGDEPADARKERLSEGVHWSYGILVSALYGAVRGHRPVPDVAGGAVFGTALWALGDELMVPVLGLSKGPTAYPTVQHAHRLGVHLLYGVAAAATTQALFSAFTPARTKRDVLWDAVKTYATWKTVKATARSAARAGETLAASGMRGTSRGLQRAVKTTTNLARGVTNGHVGGISRAVRKEGQRVTRKASKMFA